MLTAALLVTAFMPGSLWVIGAGVVAVVIRLVQIMFVVWIIRAVIGFFRAGDR